MEAGFTITKQGWHLLAKLVAGAKLEISKVMVGSGKVPEGVNPGELTDLVQPVALATSTLPVVEDKQVSFIVEYRNDLNGDLREPSEAQSGKSGGLTDGFWLNEFGVFANDPDDGEVLLYYATMGDYPQYVSAFSGGSVDIRRYPVSIALSDCEDVQLAYPAGALVTAEEMEAALVRRGVPPGGLEGQMLVKAGAGSDILTKWGPWPSNPNLLINEDFRKPVNRNGKREYTSTGGTIDRWVMDNIEKVTLQDNFITVTTTANNNGYGKIFQQLIGKQFNNKIVTASILYRNTSAQEASLALYNLSQNLWKAGIDLPTSSAWNLVTLTKTFVEDDFGNDDVFGLNIYPSTIGQNLAGSIDIIAIKLELGNQQTLAHQDAEGNWILNDPPNYDLQYALCSQYSPITGEFVGSQHSNDNLLDNAYWDNIYNVINQRNLPEYTTVGYSIDRWKLSPVDVLSMELEPDNIALHVSGASDGYPYIVYTFEYPEQYIGKQMTFSALIKNPDGLSYILNAKQATGGSGFASYTNNEGTVQNGYTLVQCTGILPVGSNHFYLFLYVGQLGTISGILHVKALKAELGPVQTLAHKEGDTWVLNDPPPSPSLELLKCQRYQNMVAKGGFQFLAVGTTSAATNKVLLYIPTAVTLRTKPTVEMNNLAVIYSSSNTQIAVNGIVDIFYTPNVVRIQLQLESQIPANTLYQICILNNNGNLLLDANL